MCWQRQAIYPAPPPRQKQCAKVRWAASFRRDCQGPHLALIGTSGPREALVTCRICGSAILDLAYRRAAPRSAIFQFYLAPMMGRSRGLKTFELSPRAHLCASSRDVGHAVERGASFRGSRRSIRPRGGGSMSRQYSAVDAGASSLNTLLVLMVEIPDRAVDCRSITSRRDETALDYMGLKPAADHRHTGGFTSFIGSCTNSR